MEIYSIYLFKLINNKWFITLSNKKLESITLYEIQSDYELVYDFINENPIIAVTKLEDYITDGYHVNKHVKLHMKQYGINNVRGGSYSDSILDENVVKVIENEINYTVSQSLADMNILYDIKQDYKNTMELEDEINKILLKVVEIKKQINSFIISEKAKLNIDYDIFVKLTERLAQYKQMKSTIFDDINWLLENIDNKEKSKERYLHIVNKELPLITKIFTSIVEDPEEYRIDGIKYEPRIHLYSPSSVLDCVFVSRCYNVESRDKAMKVINKFEYMAYVILNRTMELEFDISCYPKDYKKRYNISKAFVKRIEKKID